MGIAEIVFLAPKLTSSIESGAREYMEQTFAVVEAAYSSLTSHRRVETAEIVTALGR
jgi:hypothetical protein